MALGKLRTTALRDEAELNTGKNKQTNNETK